MRGVRSIEPKGASVTLESAFAQKMSRRREVYGTFQKRLNDSG